MLEKFEVSGFKNFRNTITLDLADVRDYKFNPACITNGTIGKAILYGKNSIGKSNFGLALFDIVSHLTSKNVTPGLYDYYLHAAAPTDCACFHYVFRYSGTVIDYSYRKNEKQQLLFEKLLMDDALFFTYDYSKDTGDLSGVQKLAPTLNWAFQDMDCVLKYVVNNTALPEDHPLRLMLRFVNNMLWFRSLDENRYIGYKSKSEDYYDFIFEDNRLELFETLLHEAGIPEKLTALQDRDGKKRLYFNTTTPLPFFHVASSGTKALYTFYYWYVTAKEVSLMFMDEFDAFYHYELAETVVSLIEKMPRTQVIVTSHNTNLLSNRIMRPDCYFILTSDRLTSLANATMRELREGHNLEKLYMSGEFDG